MSPLREKLMNPLPPPVKARKLPTDTKPPLPLGTETLPDVTERLNRMAKATAEFSNGWRNWYNARPAMPANCPEHKHQALTIDIEESVLKSWVAKRNLIAFKICPECDRQVKQAKVNYILELCGVPEDMLHCCFENFICRTEADKKAKLDSLEYAIDPKGALILVGKDYGVGKTHLSVAVMRKILWAYERRPKFTTHVAFIKALRDGYNDKKARDIIEDSIESPFLIIDDIGVTSGGRDEIPAIHTVLDERKSKNRPFILTSNAPTLKALEPFVGPRLMDRLFEFTFAAHVMSGSSMRKRRF